MVQKAVRDTAVLRVKKKKENEGGTMGSGRNRMFTQKDGGIGQHKLRRDRPSPVKARGGQSGLQNINKKGTTHQECLSGKNKNP